MSTLAAPLMIAASLAAAPTAEADDYDSGCEYIRWGFLGSQMRTICDGPRRPDGSWQRGRLISIPSHTLPARSTCSGTYSVTCTYREKQEVDMKIIEKVFYDLTDGTIPEGEPGWLPPGTEVGNA
jgi:hypothetical protein